MTDDEGTPAATYTPKDYVITYIPAVQHYLEAALRTLQPYFSELAPFATVRITRREDEQSLLEWLANCPGVTVREGLERHALDDSGTHPNGGTK